MENLGFATKTFVELIDLAGRIKNLLFACIKWMAFRADINGDGRVNIFDLVHVGVKVSIWSNLEEKKLGLCAELLGNVTLGFN